MAWNYNPKTRIARKADGIIPRIKVEEAAELLYRSGISNVRLIIDVLHILTGLSKGEIRVNVALLVEEMTGGGTAKAMERRQQTGFSGSDARARIGKSVLRGGGPQPARRWGAGGCSARASCSSRVR